MKSKCFLIVSLLSFWFNQQGVLACTQDGQTGIVEENDLYISTDAKNVSGITEEKFNEVIDDIEKIYSPIIRKMGKTLEVEKNWSNGTVNAYAQQVGNVWKVSMFGGLARHETITADGFALVLCHEIGHHLGGLPKKKSWFGATWASNEGQADYWGTLKCFRKYTENDDNIDIVSRLEVPEHATETCKANFADAAELALCQRSSMGGLSLGNLFRALKNLRTKLQFHTPDRNVVSRTDDNHPAPQCRLDTYFAGSICSVNHDVDVDNDNVNHGVCSKTEGHEYGTRPLCWYKAEA